RFSRVRRPTRARFASVVRVRFSCAWSGAATETDGSRPPRTRPRRAPVSLRRDDVDLAVRAAVVDDVVAVIALLVGGAGARIGRDRDEAVSAVRPRLTADAAP